MDTLKKLFQTFAYILAGITISSTLFITLFIPELKFSIFLQWQVIVMSAVCSLGNLVYYYKAILSKKQLRLRIIFHYIYVNIVVFGGAYLWEWITPGVIPQFLFLLLLIAAVYAIVTIACIHQEEKTADSINKQLRKRYPSERNEEN